MIVLQIDDAMQFSKKDSLCDTAGHVIGKLLSVGVGNLLPQGFHLIHNLQDRNASRWQEG